MSITLNFQRYVSTTYIWTYSMEWNCKQNDQALNLSDLPINLTYLIHSTTIYIADGKKYFCLRKTVSPKICQTLLCIWIGDCHGGKKKFLGNWVDYVYLWFSLLQVDVSLRRPEAHLSERGSDKLSVTIYFRTKGTSKNPFKCFNLSQIGDSC